MPKKAKLTERELLYQRNGKPAAVIVPLKEYLAMLAHLEEYQDIIDARESLKEAKTSGTIPIQKIKERLGLK